jgi:protein-disulfide isomerase
MTYYKRQNNAFLKLLTAGVISLGLGACDSGSAPKSDETMTEDSTESPASTAPLEKVEIEYSAAQVVDGIALGELTMGAPNAPVTIIEYASLTCPHCAAFHTTVFKQIKENYIDTGKVKFVFRNYVFNQQDLTASMVSRCAGPQKSWGMMNLFFERQRQWLEGEYIDNLATLARRAGMNRAKFDVCLQNADLQKSLVEMRNSAVADGVTSTPYFLVGDKVISGETPFEEFAEVIEDSM